MHNFYSSGALFWATTPRSFLPFEWNSASIVTFVFDILVTWEQTGKSPHLENIQITSASALEGQRDDLQVLAQLVDSHIGLTLYIKPFIPFCTLERVYPPREMVSTSPVATPLASRRATLIYPLVTSMPSPYHDRSMITGLNHAVGPIAIPLPVAQNEYHLRGR